jgi:hypothetical protein
MAKLATQGVLPDEVGKKEEIEKDIEKHLKDSDLERCACVLNEEEDYSIIPAVWYGDFRNIILCGHVDYTEGGLAHLKILNDEDLRDLKEFNDNELKKTITDLIEHPENRQKYENRYNTQKIKFDDEYKRLKEKCDSEYNTYKGKIPKPIDPSQSADNPQPSKKKHHHSHSWLKKQFRHTKIFVQKHKKVIIIGAVVIIGVVVIYYAISAEAASAAAKAAAGAGALAQAKKKDKDKNDTTDNSKTTETSSKPVEVEDRTIATNENIPKIQSTPVIQEATEKSATVNSEKDIQVPFSKENTVIEAHSAEPREEYPPVPPEKEIIDSQVLVYKENIAKEILSTEKMENHEFADTLKEFGSHFAHQTFQEASEFAEILPQLEEEINKLRECWFPDEKLPLLGVENITPREKFEKLVTYGHTLIDKAFSTNQGKDYAPEVRANAEAFAKKFGYEPSIGVLPPPTKMLNNVAKAGEKIVEAEKASATVIEAEKPIKPIIGTQPSSVSGWSKGEEITNLTKKGDVPQWDAVRARYWKNQAIKEPEKYTSEQLERMKKGLAPQRFNEEKGIWESKELHHEPPQREGGLFDVEELWPDEHANADKFRKTGG